MLAGMPVEAISDWLAVDFLVCFCFLRFFLHCKKGSPYSIAERRVPELIPVLGSQPAGDVSHKPSSSFRQAAVTLASLKRAATSFAAW